MQEGQAEAGEADAGEALVHEAGWDVRFGDAGVERAYRAHAAREGMALSFLGLVLGTAAFCAFAVLDRLLLTDAAFARVSQLRAGYVLGVLVPAVLVAWRRPALWQRYEEGLVFSLSLSAHLVFVGIMGLVGDVEVVRHQYAGLFLVGLFVHVFLRPRTRCVIVMQVVWGAAWLLMVSRLGPGSHEVMLTSGFYLAVAAAVMPAAAYRREAAARRAFRAQRQLERFAAELADTAQRLDALVHTDALTGAASRRHLLAQGAQEVGRARRHAVPLSVLMLDVDHFKAINDRHGHAAGDAALQALVAACRGQLRGTDVVGRLGGEEFALLLPHTGAEGAVAFAERLREALAALVVEGPSGPFRFTVSLGAAELADTDAGLEALLARADAALYRAKREGRNRVVLAPPALPRVLGAVG
jgi:diguanylate cyclase (GGDEF)-like protein